MYVCCYSYFEKFVTHFSSLEMRKIFQDSYFYNKCSHYDEECNENIYNALDKNIYNALDKNIYNPLDKNIYINLFITL